MSKWVNTEKFDDFREERENDKQKENPITFARKYPNPKMGDQNRPHEYHLRLLPDPDGNFYKKYFYHMFQSGESWHYIVCPKTHGMDNYCPWCAITQLLYQGSSADKKKASQYKRRDRYVGNVFVEKDPRDANENDPEKKFAGKTFLYEFPATVEGQIRKEITDTENGWGYVIFDPEEGHNLILRIGAKKPDPNGKVWPDYSQTTFAKRPSAIADSDTEIEEIMESVQSIDEYIENSMWEADAHENLLKSEMVWEDVEDDFCRHFETALDVSESQEDDDSDPDEEAHGRSDEQEQEPERPTRRGRKTSKKEDKEEQSDQDLLDELADL
jgi:hypothetical protein